MSVIASEPVRILPECLSPANQRRLFVHDPTVMEDPGYHGLSLSAQHRFPERALWLADPDDLVLLSQPAEPAYLRYLQSLGAGPNNTCYVPAQEDRALVETLLADAQWPAPVLEWAVNQSTPVQVDTFCTTPATAQLVASLSHSLGNARALTGDPSTTLQANHKSWINAQLADLGIPKIPGFTVTNTAGTMKDTIDQARDCVAALGEAYDKLVVRTDYSSGGKGNLLVAVHDTVRLETWLLQNRAANSFLIEAYLPWRSSPNAQYWLSPDGEAQCFQITDQRVSGVVSHFGNTYPAAAQADRELLAQSKTIASWLAQQGIRGFVGIDFIDTHAHGMRFVEVNARVNGSTYASAIALRVNYCRAVRDLAPVSSWNMIRKVPVAIASFAEMQRVAGDLIYDHTKGQGVVPYWTGALPYGLCSCVTLGPDAGQTQALEREFIKRVRGR